MVVYRRRNFEKYFHQRECILTWLTYYYQSFHRYIVECMSYWFSVINDTDIKQPYYRKHARGRWLLNNDVSCGQCVNNAIVHKLWSVTSWQFIGSLKQMWIMWVIIGLGNGFPLFVAKSISILITTNHQASRKTYRFEQHFFWILMYIYVLAAPTRICTLVFKRNAAQINMFWRMNYFWRFCRQCCRHLGSDFGYISYSSKCWGRNILVKLHKYGNTMFNGNLVAGVIQSPDASDTKYLFFPFSTTIYTINGNWN